jgi:pimeloyl-ACP methyl ester carboxylesterase
VNGLEMYYEVHGAGEPLVVLHGGVGAHEMFEPNLPALAKNRLVIAADLQGHGNTADIDRPLSFESMADDVAALITHLGFTHADIMGYSLGGGGALQATIRHPDVVRKLVLVSTPFRRDGFYPEVLANFAQMGPEAAQWMKQSPLAKLYPRVDWARLFTKLGELLRTDYDWSKGVSSIKVPTMIVYADADSFRPAHIMEFYGLLGGGKRDAGLDGSGRAVARLAIVPGFTHYTVLSSPMVPALVTPFLDAPL